MYMHNKIVKHCIFFLYFYGNKDVKLWSFRNGRYSLYRYFNELQRLADPPPPHLFAYIAVCLIT